MYTDNKKKLAMALLLCTSLMSHHQSFTAALKNNTSTLQEENKKQEIKKPSLVKRYWKQVAITGGAILALVGYSKYSKNPNPPSPKPQPEEGLERSSTRPRRPSVSDGSCSPQDRLFDCDDSSDEEEDDQGSPQQSMIGKTLSFVNLFNRGNAATYHSTDAQTFKVMDYKQNIIELTLEHGTYCTYLGRDSSRWTYDTRNHGVRRVHLARMPQSSIESQVPLMIPQPLPVAQSEEAKILPRSHIPTFSGSLSSIAQESIRNGAILPIILHEGVSYLQLTQTELIPVTSSPENNVLLGAPEFYDQSIVYKKYVASQNKDCAVFAGYVTKPNS